MAQVTAPATGPPPIPAAFRPPAQPLLAPVAQHERIASIDVIRGVAVLGILLMNIDSFGLPGVAGFDPSVAGGASGLNLVIWFGEHVLFEGKMRALFSMLFGAGVILLTARAEERGEQARIADIYYRRTLWLIAFGLLHAYLLWEGDILFYYGVAGLALFPLRKVRARYLVAAGLVLLGVLSLRMFAELRMTEDLRERGLAAQAAAKAGRALSESQQEAKEEWEAAEKDFRPDARAIARTVAAHRSDYFTLLAFRAREVQGWQSTFYYRFGFLDVAGMMLIGMGLMKLGVFSAARSPGVYKGLMLAGFGLGIPVCIYTGYRFYASRFDPLVMQSNWTAYSFARLLVALGHLGLVMFLFQRGRFPALTRRLAAVGQMALSNYIAETVLCTTLFYGYGFGLYNHLVRWQLLLVVFVVCAILLAISPLWLRHFRFGPLEWAWRSLTYWQWQPMLRDRSEQNLVAQPSAA